MTEKILKSRVQLGKKIAQLRNKKQISQKSLALQLGISYAYLANVELGRVSIGHDNLQRILFALDAKMAVVEK